MKTKDLAPEILVEIIRAARDISVAKIESLSRLQKEYNTKHNFFDLEFNRIVDSITIRIDSEKDFRK